MGNIIMALLILSASTGLVISRHYCNDQLVETTVYVEAETCCDDGNCCTTNTVLVKLDEDAVNQSLAQLPDTENIQLFLPLLVSHVSVQLAIDPVKKVLQIAAPPPVLIKSFLAFIQTYRL